MNRIEEIDAQIKLLADEKTAIQTACVHPPLCMRYRYGSNTGSFDSHSDSYWTDLRCTLCAKIWTVEGSVSPGIGARRIEKGKAL